MPGWRNAPRPPPYLALARAEDGALRLDEAKARQLAETFTAYLTAARDLGRVDVTPGRFLLPGDLAGSPVLTFAPLPKPATTGRDSLWREMERRYEAYKSKVVRPFFRDHFAKIDRQIVLADVLGAIHQGPRAVEDLRRMMAEVLAGFRPGRNTWLSGLFGAHRVERILFAATKADHLHHEQHPALTAITDQPSGRGEVARRFLRGPDRGDVAGQPAGHGGGGGDARRGRGLPAVRGHASVDRQARADVSRCAADGPVAPPVVRAGGGGGLA